MKKTLLVAILAIGAVTANGCGTVCNLAGGVVHPDKEPKVYGGVQRDIEILDKALQEPARQTSLGSAGGYMLIVAVAVADPIASFLGDTLTLPLTVYLQNKRIAAESPSPANSSGSGVSLGAPKPDDQAGGGN